MEDIDLLDSKEEKKKKRSWKKSPEFQLTDPDKVNMNSGGLKEVKKSVWSDVFNKDTKKEKRKFSPDTNNADSFSDQSVSRSFGEDFTSPERVRGQKAKIDLGDVEIPKKPASFQPIVFRGVQPSADTAGQSSSSSVKSYAPVLSTVRRSKEKKKGLKQKKLSFWQKLFSPSVKPTKSPVTKIPATEVSAFSSSSQVEVKNGFDYMKTVKPGGGVNNGQSHDVSKPSPQTRVFTPHHSFLPKISEVRPTTGTLSKKSSIISPKKKGSSDKTSFWKKLFGGRSDNQPKFHDRVKGVTPPATVKKTKIPLAGVTSSISSPFHLGKRSFGGNGSGIDVNLVPGALSDQPLRRARLLGFVAGMSAVLVVLVYALLGVYSFVLNSTTKDIAKEIEQLDKQIVTYNQVRAEAEKANRHLAALDGLLNQHIYWSNFLEYLEQYTLSSTHYLEVAGDTGGRVSLKAATDSYQSVGKQLMAFEQARDFIQDVSIREGSIEEKVVVNEAGEETGVSRRIIFTVDLTVKSDIFYFKALESDLSQR